MSTIPEVDFPHIVGAFIEAQDKCRCCRQTLDLDAEDAHSEDNLSDSVDDLGDSADKLLTNEDSSSKDVNYVLLKQNYTWWV